MKAKKLRLGIIVAILAITLSMTAVPPAMAAVTWTADATNYFDNYLGPMLTALGLNATEVAYYKGEISTNAEAYVTVIGTNEVNVNILRFILASGMLQLDPVSFPDIGVAYGTIASLEAYVGWPSPLSAPILSIDPDPVEIYTAAADKYCTEFNISVRIDSVVDMKGYEFKLGFNTTLLNVTGADAIGQDLGGKLTPGPVNYVPTGPPMWGPMDQTGTYWTPLVNITDGFVWVSCGFLMGSFTGSGVLMTITLHIEYDIPRIDVMVPTNKSVSCDLDLFDTVLGNSLGEPIPHLVNDGEYVYTRAMRLVGKPNAWFTWSPTFPYVCDTVRCTDQSTPDGGYIWDWDWVIVSGPAHWTTANNDDFREFHCDGPGDVVVKLTVYDSEGLNDYVTRTITQLEAVGALLDLWTSSNRFCGQTTTFIGTGAAVNPDTGEIVPGSAYVDALTPDVNITLYAKVTWGGAPRMHVLVAFEILYETGNNACIAYRTAETDKDGIAVTWFRVPTWCTGLPFGKWLVIATGKVQEIKQQDWIRFDVGYLIELDNVWTVDPVSKTPKDTFNVYETVGVMVSGKNIALMSKWVQFVAVAYDDCDVPVDQDLNGQPEAAGVYCSPNTFEEYFELVLPQWTYVGTGKIYVSAFTALPSECGVPYCPEVSTTFIIKWVAP